MWSPTKAGNNNTDLRIFISKTNKRYSSIHPSIQSLIRLIKANKTEDLVELITPFVMVSIEMDNIYISMYYRKLILLFMSLMMALKLKNSRQI